MFQKLYFAISYQNFNMVGCSLT